jgi:cytochrome c
VGGAVAVSKFANIEGHGLTKRGHITLQAHGDIVWFRNIKIREVPAAR